MKNKILDFLVTEAKKYPGIRRLILFGSRARKQAQERSDYDVAVDEDLSALDWAKFSLQVKENVPTLCGIDLIRLKQTSARLKKSIQRDGVVFFQADSRKPPPLSAAG